MMTSELSAGAPVSQCDKCGRELTIANSAITQSTCLTCRYGGDFVSRLVDMAPMFEKFPQMEVEELEMYGIGASAGRLIIGALIMSGAAYAGTAFYGALGGLGAWVLGGLIVGIGVFRNANALDTIRWKRFWKGHLLGFIVGAFAAAILLAPPRGSRDGFEFVLFGMASLCGIIAGFLWIAIKNGDDRLDLIPVFKEWKWRQRRA